MRILIYIIIISTSIQNAYSLCVGLGCNCTVDSPTLNFGSINPISGNNHDESVVVQVTCEALVVNALVSYDLMANAGNSGDMNNRTMTGPSALNYNLYKDNTFNTIWGNGTGVTDYINFGYLINLLAPRTDQFTIYARIPPQPTTPAGNYSDSVSLVLNF